MRAKRLTVSIAFFLLSIFLVKGAVGFSMSCFSGMLNNSSLVQPNNSDDAEKVPEEKNLLAEEYVHSFHPVLINHPTDVDADQRKVIRNTFVPQAVYLSIPEPPPNDAIA